MKSAFDDPKVLSMILREQERSATAFSVLDKLTEQRSAAASNMLDKLTEQRSAAAFNMLDKLTEQRSAAAFNMLDKLTEQRSEAANRTLERLSDQKAAFANITLERLAQESAGIGGIAAGLMAVRNATGSNLSEALAAATLANGSLAQMIQDTVGALDWNKTLGGISKDWLQEKNLVGSEMLAVATAAAFKSHLIDIAGISSQAEAALSSLLPGRLGLALPFSDEVTKALTGTFVDFSHSYRGLVESFEASPVRLLSLGPSLSRLPAIEYYNSAILSRSISVDEDNEEGAYGQDETANEAGEPIDGFLVRLNPKLVQIRNGARQALTSKNPDRVRHFSSSYRELLTHVLHALAPDDEIRQWSVSPEHYHNKRPTRKARLLYISRQINQKPFETFVDKDIEAVLEFFELLNSGTHKVDSSYTPVQLKALQIRIEGAIRFLFEISQA